MPPLVRAEQGLERAGEPFGALLGALRRSIEMGHRAQAVRGRWTHENTTTSSFGGDGLGLRLDKSDIDDVRLYGGEVHSRSPGRREGLREETGSSVIFGEPRTIVLH